MAFSPLAELNRRILNHRMILLLTKSYKFCTSHGKSTPSALSFSSRYRFDLSIRSLRASGYSSRGWDPTSASTFASSSMTNSTNLLSLHFLVMCLTISLVFSRYNCAIVCSVVMCLSLSLSISRYFGKYRCRHFCELISFLWILIFFLSTNRCKLGLK